MLRSTLNLLPLLPSLLGMAMLGTSQVVDDPPDEGGGTAEADPTAGESIDKAGERFLSGLTDEQRNAPLAVPDDKEEDGAGEARRPAPAEAVTEDEEEEDSDGAAGEPIVRATDGAEWNGEAERWVLDGQFVAGEAPEGWVKPAKPAAAATPAPKAKPDERAPALKAGKPSKIVLQGQEDRSEEDLEVEIDDPEILARLQRLQKEGMRGKHYRERLAGLDRREAQLEAAEQEMEIDPIGFQLKRVPKAQQIELARALLLEHYDDLAVELEEMGGDSEKRLRAQLALRDQQGAASKRVTAARQVQQFAKSCVREAEALVPEGTGDATAARFMAAARAALADASDAGQIRSEKDVKQVLAGLVSDYGFDRPAPNPRAPAPKKPADPPPARPVTPKAREIAGRRPTPTGAPADAAATQARIRRAQAARAGAARVAPAGAGAAPVQVPTLPPEAEADVEAASKYLRKSGKLPDTWAGMVPR